MEGESTGKDLYRKDSRSPNILEMVNGSSRRRRLLVQALKTTEKNGERQSETNRARKTCNEIEISDERSQQRTTGCTEGAQSRNDEACVTNSMQQYEGERHVVAHGQFLPHEKTRNLMTATKYSMNSKNPFVKVTMSDIKLPVIDTGQIKDVSVINNCTSTVSEKQFKGSDMDSLSSEKQGAASSKNGSIDNKVDGKEAHGNETRGLKMKEKSEVEDFRTEKSDESLSPREESMMKRKIRLLHSLKNLTRRNSENLSTIQSQLIDRKNSKKMKIQYLTINTDNSSSLSDIEVELNKLGSNLGRLRQEIKDIKIDAEKCFDLGNHLQIQGARYRSQTM